MIVLRIPMEAIMKRLILITLLGLSLLVTACSAAKNTTPTPAAAPTAVADNGVIAEGRLEPVRYAEIAFNASGVVSEVMVKEGQQVNKGQPLIRLGDKSDNQYAAAQLELVTAEKALNDLLNASGTDLAQAVIDLRDAQEDFDKADDYLSYLKDSKKVSQTETRT